MTTQSSSSPPSSPGRMHPANSIGLCVFRHKVSGRNCRQNNPGSQCCLGFSLMHHARFAILLLLFFCSAASAEALSTTRPPRVAILDLGNEGFGVRIAGDLHASLSAENQLVLLDRGIARAAARGIGYNGSLNMTL